MLLSAVRVKRCEYICMSPLQLHWAGLSHEIQWSLCWQNVKRFKGYEHFWKTVLLVIISTTPISPQANNRCKARRLMFCNMQVVWSPVRFILRFFRISVRCHFLFEVMIACQFLCHSSPLRPSLPPEEVLHLQHLQLSLTLKGRVAEAKRRLTGLVRLVKKRTLSSKNNLTHLYLPITSPSTLARFLSINVLKDRTKSCLSPTL